MRLDPATLAQIAAIAAEARRVDPEDDTLALDMVEGETDALDLLDRLIMEAQWAEAMKAQTRQAAQEIDQRLKRRESAFGSRSDAARQGIKIILAAMGQKKVKRPCATLSISRTERQALEITDEAAIPTQLRKLGPPDKDAVTKQLEAGEAVPGAQIVTVTKETLTMRTS